MAKGKAGIRQLRMSIERKEGLVFNEKRIARIKRKFGLVTLIRRKNKYRTFAKAKHEHESFPNLLNRKFKQPRPDMVYSTDITQLNYGNQKAYLAAMKDLCTGEVIANLSPRPDVNLTRKVLDKSLRKLTKEQKSSLIIHSDQGFHFTHYTFRDRLKRESIRQSMSRKGNCLDNAPIESFFGTIKDLLDLEECKNFKDLEKEVTRKIKYYNQKRPQYGLKKMPPIEYRRQFHS